MSPPGRAASFRTNGCLRVGFWGGCLLEPRPDNKPQLDVYCRLPGKPKEKEPCEAGIVNRQGANTQDCAEHTTQKYMQHSRSSHHGDTEVRRAGRQPKQNTQVTEHVWNTTHTTVDTGRKKARSQGCNKNSCCELHERMGAALHTSDP